MIILDSGVGNYILFNNKQYSYFAGNNYLGLANHPEVKDAAIRSIERFGINFSASRKTTGTAGIHLELEKQLSAFKQKEDAVVFASGYLGNAILLQVLRKEYSAVFIDESSHPSILEAIPRDISRIFQYEHRSSSHLEALLKKNRRFRPLIITDGLFALTGEIAPLGQIFPLAQRYHAILVVDDAHSTGILGENGRGTPEYFHLEEAENLFQTETMSKAIGVYGGFIAGSLELTASIRAGSTVYQASTSLPPPVVSAGIASLKLMEEQPGLRIKLLSMASEIRTGISNLGFNTTPDNTPIIPVMFRTFEEAKQLSEFLEEHNIVVPCIQYPVKTKLSMIRITACVNHTREQTGSLLEILKKWRDKNGTGKD
jgi:7-keto-8-aminopelargonate synthetase-like enzyme